jgi:cyclopropane fatty-acyl-phospholipid synthase-like methyltransferase
MVTVGGTVERFPQTADRLRPRVSSSAGAAALADVIVRSGISCEVMLPDGSRLTFGDPPPAVTVTIHSDRALALPLTEYSVAKAYIEGEIDVDGDFRKMFAVRDSLRLGLRPSQALRFAYDLFVRSPVRQNRQAISQHYELGDDLYLTFLDRRYRLYSQCLFPSGHESLEDAAELKLSTMWRATGLEPGMRVLDIGAGWGGVTDYCAPRGVHVTSLTLAEDSARFIRALLERHDLDGTVIRGDVLEFEPAAPFDHAVMHGVIEHVPNYARFCRRAWELLKPGGRLYLDGSATKEKFAISPIAREEIWAGHHSFMALQELVRELLFHGFEVIEVERETRDYELTISNWAERFEAARDEIVGRWGERLYRSFRVYLWGGAHALATNRLQAYHVVAERRADPGPRPGLSRRMAGFVSTLR